MFAVLFNKEDGKEFKIYPTHDEARAAAISASLNGTTSTIYDYDITTDKFIEFYQIV